MSCIDYFKKMNEEYLFSGNNYNINVDALPKAKPRGRSPMTYNEDRTKWAQREPVVSRDAVLCAPLRELARMHTLEAIDTIVGLMRNAEKEPVRLAAAAMLLDRAYGKPTIHIEDQGDKAELTIDASKLSTVTREALDELMGIIDNDKQSNG